MNYIQVVGRIEKMPQVIKSGTNERYSVIFVEVSANFRDHDGVFRVDTFPIRLWRGMSETIADLCVPGSTVAIKGRLERSHNEYMIIAEQVEFLQPK